NTTTLAAPIAAYSCHFLALPFFFFIMKLLFFFTILCYYTKFPSSKQYSSGLSNRSEFFFSIVLDI
ncbi:hypothetical protein, partial [Streptococcus pneumoniae]|uniref:hypothetical protein n=1 Tax=Streptococcus pneumoniae TaxID=1313 RepID=UPI001C537290